MERKVVEDIIEVLRGAGYADVETRRSSRSVTVSAHKEGITAVVHLDDTTAPPTVRAGLRGNVPEFALKAFAPTAGPRSGSGS